MVQLHLSDRIPANAAARSGAHESQGAGKQRNQVKSSQVKVKVKVKLRDSLKFTPW